MTLLTISHAHYRGIHGEVRDERILIRGKRIMIKTQPHEARRAVPEVPAARQLASDKRAEGSPRDGSVAALHLAIFIDGSGFSDRCL